MSSKIESQLQALHASPKYFVWVNYFLSSPPLSNNEVQKLIKKNKHDYYQYFKLKTCSKDASSNIKSDLSQCESQNQIESVLKAAFELAKPIGDEIKIVQYAKSPEAQAEKKEIRSYIESEIMQILISISCLFEADLYALRENLPNERFSPELWNLFYLFIDYFTDVKEKVFLDFLAVIEPIVIALNEAIDLILKLDESKLAFIFLKSIIDPLFKCLQIEHKVRKQSNLLILSFFVSLVKGVLHYSHFQLFSDSLNKFFELECKNCNELSKNDQNSLIEVSKEFILQIQQKNFQNEMDDDEKEKEKLSLFQIGFNCSKMNTSLCKSSDNSYITFSIDFVIWSISTFPVKIFKYPHASAIKRPIKEIEINSPIEPLSKQSLQGGVHNDSNNTDYKSKHKTPNPISYLCSNEQLNDLYNHLIEIRPIYAQIANKDIVFSHLSSSYDSIDLIVNKHVFIAFAIILLKKEPNVKSPDGTLQFIYEPSVFTIPNDAPDGKHPSFSQLDLLASNFISRLQSFIFKFSQKSCVLSDGRRSILSSLGSQLDRVKSNESEMYYYIQNLMPLLKVLRFYDLTVFGIVDNLLEFMNSHLNTELGVQLFQFIQSLIVRNPTLYFSKETIIDQFTINSKNEYFTASIYNTLITSMKYCCARKEFTCLFEDVLRHIAKCLLDEYKTKSDSMIEVLQSFMNSVKELNLSSFYSSHFPGEIIHSLIEIPKLIKRDDLLLESLNFMKSIGCISNSDASSTLAISLKEVELTPEIIDILMFIIFEKDVKLNDEKILSQVIIKNSYGLKPLMMISQDTQYEDDVLLFIFNIMTENKSRYNSLQCSNGDVVKCALLLYLKKKKEICVNIITLIIGINPSASSLESIYEIIYDLSKEDNQELNNSSDLSWLTDFLCKLSCENDKDSSLYVDLSSPIKDISLNGSLLGKKFVVTMIFSLKEGKKSTIFEISGSNNTLYSVYYEDSTFHVKVESKENNFILDFPNISKKAILKWKEIKFSFTQHHVSLNKEKVQCELPPLPEQCKLRIGDEGIQLSYIKFESKKKQKILYELDPKLYKEPNLYFASYGEKSKDQSLSEIKFNGFITYCESVVSSFRNNDFFTSFFNAMRNKKYFKSLLLFFHNIFVKEVQEVFYEKNAIVNLVDSLEYAKDYLTQDNLKVLYSIYPQISTQKVKTQYFIQVLMNPSLFIQAQYPTAKEYCEKILPDISSSYQDDFYNFFNENENFNRFFEGILTMKHNDSNSENLVNIIWLIFQDIFVKKHSFNLYKTFIVAMGKCNNHYFAYNALLFFAEKITNFYKIVLSDNSDGNLKSSGKNAHLSARKSDPEKLTDEQRSDFELEKALSEKESLPMFILIMPLVPDKNKRICLKCLADLVQNCQIKSGYLTNEILSILGKFTVEKENALSLISDCMSMMANYRMPEMIPLISYLSTFLNLDEANKTFQKFLSSVNSIMKIIVIVPFWIYWIMLFYQNTLEKKDKHLTLNNDLIEKFFPSKIDLTIIQTAFLTFDTLTILKGDDYHQIKEDILKFYISKFEPNNIFDQEKSSFDENFNDDDQKMFLNLLSLLFTHLVVQIIPENKDGDNNVSDFDTVALRKCLELRETVSPKNVIFDLRISGKKSKNGGIKMKWSDSKLANYFIDKIAYPAQCRIQYKLYWNNHKKVAVPVQKALGYIIANMIRIDKKSIPILKIKKLLLEIEPRADGGTVHDMIGMILSCYGINDVRQQIASNEDIQTLYDIYDVIHDDIDSPDLDLFVFEDYLQSNLNEILKSPLPFHKKK